MRSRYTLGGIYNTNLLIQAECSNVFHLKLEDTQITCFKIVERYNSNSSRTQF